MKQESSHEERHALESRAWALYLLTDRIIPKAVRVQGMGANQDTEELPEPSVFRQSCASPPLEGLSDHTCAAAAVSSLSSCRRVCVRSKFPIDCGPRSLKNTMKTNFWKIAFKMVFKM